MVISRARKYARSYGDLILGGAELEKLRSLRILGVTINSKLTVKNHLREVTSKAVRSVCVMRRPGKLFDCSRVLKGCFKGHVSFNLEYCSTPCGCRLRSLISVCWIVLFTV